MSTNLYTYFSAKRELMAEGFDAIDVEVILNSIIDAGLEHAPQPDADWLFTVSELALAREQLSGGDNKDRTNG